MAITPAVPGAADEAWSTPARPPCPVVGGVPVSAEVVPGGQGIAFTGDADPGGRDTVAASVQEAVANTEARYHELAADTYGAGSQIGDVMDLPPVISDWSKHTAGSDAMSYDPAG
jgi:hypothetical protein